VVAAPRFFAGKIQLGGLMQTASAFGQVQGALSYIINSYTSIADWRAVIQRLSGFHHNMDQAAASHVNAEFELGMAAEPAIIAENLTIQLPDGRALLHDINLTLRPATALLITGASGSGKSTLLRTLAGIWPFATGKLLLPSNAKILFVPQKPYLPLGTLRQVLSYPNAPTADDATLHSLLALCHLDHLKDQLDAAETWSRVLSLGEQQRIGFVRILLTQPDFLFLDEATSALDETAEAEFYKLLKQRLPHTAIISIGHRSTLNAFHTAIMQL
jgi:putative ATP-binding cassette transporter